MAAMVATTLVDAAMAAPVTTEKHGLLFDGSPTKTSNDEVFRIAQEQGATIKKVVTSDDVIPSATGEYISYQKLSINRFKDLGASVDVTDLLDKLDGRPLTAAEEVVHFLAKQMKESMTETKEEMRKLQENMDKLEKLNEMGTSKLDKLEKLNEMGTSKLDKLEKLNEMGTSKLDKLEKLNEMGTSKLDKLEKLNEMGTSSLILVYDCVHHLEDELTPLLRQRLKSCEEATKTQLGKVIKVFQRNFKDPMLKKTTGPCSKVPAAVGFITFAAALRDFLCDHGKYKMVLTDEEGKDDRDSPFYTEETAWTFVEPLLKVYSSCMAEMVDGLPGIEDLSTMKAFATDIDNAKEWLNLFKMRQERDHKGGHCATWRESPSPAKEADRLKQVVRIFLGLVKDGDSRLKGLPILSKCAASYMTKYVAEREKNAMPLEVAKPRSSLLDKAATLRL